MIIRHGQSTNNLLHQTSGTWVGRSPDPELTPLGHQQAAQLGQFFADERLVRPSVLITSLMLRAVQTAAPLAEALDVCLEGHLELNEVRGVYAGSPSEPEPHAGSPASTLVGASGRLGLPDLADEDGWYRRGVETPAGAVARAEKVVADLRSRFDDTDEVVAVVCHEWISQYLLRAALGVLTPENSEIPWFTLNNTATTLVSYAQGSAGERLPPTVTWTNRTDHLRADQITT